MKSFDKKLKAWRKKLGISQPKAALKLGVKLRTLQSWEQKANTPSVYALESLLARMKESAGLAEVED